MKFFLAIIFGGHLYASNCGSREVSLYFANGMFNSYDAADKGREELSWVAKRPVKLAYNFNEDAITELIQVAEQKGEELARVFWQQLL